MNDIETWIPRAFLIGIGIFIGFMLWHPINNDYVSRQDYNTLFEKYQNISRENEMLKAQQKQLSDQIATYLIEQTSIDLFGLKKYSVAYDLLKIVICNKNKTVIFC